MRSLAAIAFSFAAAILSLCLLPVGHWVFWAAGILAAAGGVVLLLPRLRALGRLRVYLALITLSLAAGLLYGRGWSALVAQPVQDKCGSSHLFSATVCDWPEQRDSGWRVTVRLADARGAKAACYLSNEAVIFWKIRLPMRIRMALGRLSTGMIYPLHPVISINRLQDS